MDTKYPDTTAAAENKMVENTGWNGGPEYSDHASNEHYEELFIRWSNRWERVIRILILAFLILLLLSQAMLQWPLFRKSVVKIEKLEGEPYTQTFDSR